MNKLSSIIVITALTTNLFADSSFQMGYSSNDVKNSNNKNGFYIGLDALKNVNGFLFGGGIDTNTFHINNNGAYTMAAEAKTGYTLKNAYNIPLSIKVGLGFGITHFYSNNNNNNDWSICYSTSAEYDIYKGWGVGAKYKSTEVEFANTKFDIDSTIFYINKSF